MATDYSIYLSRGIDNAVPAEELAKALSFKDTRALRADISRSREAGQVICSSAKGYYLPESREEIERFIKWMEARAKHTFIAIRSARNAIKQAERVDHLEETGIQLNLNDLEGEGLDIRTPDS